jgi:transposase
MQSITTIGVDVAKSVFQVHCVDAAGQVVMRRQLKRRYVLENVEPALLRRSPSTFEGENEQARLSRRKRNWIADVQFEATS